MYETYQDDGLIVITALGEDTEGGRPSTDDLTTWTETYGLTHPVVADPGFEVMWELGGNGGLPFMALADEGVLLLDTSGHFTEADVEAALAD
jgi:hypothetical protein